MNLASLEDIRDFDANQRMDELYSQLKSVLKWHHPRDYAAFMARKLAIAFENRTLLARYRPHHGLHSIEANCAYSNPRFREPVNEDHIANVMNIYHEHQDPMHSGLLEDKKLNQFCLVMHREQMGVQYSSSSNEMARYQALFLENDPIPNLAKHFRTRMGISIESWITMCFFATTAADMNPGRVFNQSVFAECPRYGVPEEEVTCFLKHSSISPSEIGDRYRSLREQTKPQFHSQIRSVFLERPLIGLGNDEYIAPHSPLILRHSGQGLYKAIKCFPDFGEEFGATVCRYVMKLLGCLTASSRMLTNSELERYSPGKSCDFLVELEDIVLLVESKATSFVAKRLVDSAILNDGSTSKIAKGIEQLYTTAFDIRSGVFGALGVDRHKNVLGVVSTFGEIPFVNSDWYRENFIVKRAESKLADPIFPSETMVRWPIVMSLDTLQSLVITLNSFDAGLSELVDEKDGKLYIQVGDWDSFLANKMSEDPSALKSLQFVTDQNHAFLERFRDS